MNRLSRELQRAALPALLLLALVAAGALAASTARDAGAANETALLAVWAGLALAPLAWAATRAAPGGTIGRARQRIGGLAVAGAALAIAMIVALLPRDGVSRAAAAAAVLTIAVVVVAWARLSRPPAPAANLAALALGSAVVAYGHRLWVDPSSPGTIVRLVALPAIATAVAVLLARRGRPGAGEIAGALVLLFPLATGEPLWLLATLLTLALAAGLGAPTGWLAASARGVLGAAAAAALLAGGFPWLRPAPVATVLTVLLAAPPAQHELLERPATLDGKRTRLEVALAGTPLTALRVDSYLTHSAALPCGTPIARLEIVPAGGGAPVGGELRIGRDSAEWAADRADVAARLQCAAPPAWASFIPASGRFLGRLSRTRLALPRLLAGDRLIVERDPALPPELALSLFGLVAER